MSIRQTSFILLKKQNLIYKAISGFQTLKTFNYMFVKNYKSRKTNFPLKIRLKNECYQT